MKAFGQRVLLAYSSIVSTVLAFVLLTGTKSRVQSFDEIQTRRINIGAR
jgi:hypothetical protein